MPIKVWGLGDELLKFVLYMDDRNEWKYGSVLYG